MDEAVLVRLSKSGRDVDSEAEEDPVSTPDRSRLHPRLEGRSSYRNTAELRSQKFVALQHRLGVGLTAWQLAHRFARALLHETLPKSPIKT